MIVWTWCVCVAVGPLCEYRSNVEAEDIADNCTSLLCHYEAALTPPNCTTSDGTNSFTWTPDESTPDVVYYQVCVCVCTCACMRGCVCMHVHYAYVMQAYCNSLLYIDKH